MPSRDMFPLRPTAAPHQLDSTTSAEVAKHFLPKHYVPSKYCVLCGRGREYFNSIGNRRFRVLVNIYLEKYKEAPNRLVKGQIVSEIVDTVRGSGGQFAKLDEHGRWWEIGDCGAREKVGALFRDTLHEVYRSSGKAKKARRASMTSSDGSSRTPSPPPESSSPSPEYTNFF